MVIIVFNKEILLNISKNNRNSLRCASTTSAIKFYDLFLLKYTETFVFQYTLYLNVFYWVKNQTCINFIFLLNIITEELKLMVIFYR